jgi:hypothetical protein
LGGAQTKIIGGAATVADELERWFEITGVDGFNLAHITNPGSFEDIINYLLPELQRRGRFRTGVEKEVATAREAYLGSKRLPEDHPGSRFKWRAGEKIPKYQLEEDADNDVEDGNREEAQSLKRERETEGEKEGVKKKTKVNGRAK